jgi:hypothetical protein
MGVKVDLDDYANTIIQMMQSDQQLCKLLYYDTDQPLAESDIVDTSILSNKDNPDRRIFAIPFSPDVHASQKTTIHIELSKSEMTEEKYYKTVNICFIVLCHNHLWELYTGINSISLRPNKISARLFELFYNKQSIGIGSSCYAETDNIHLNDSVTGYKIIFSNIDFTFNS